MENRERIVSLITPYGPCSQLTCFTGALDKLGYRTETISLSNDNIENSHSRHDQVLFVPRTGTLNGLLTRRHDKSDFSRLAVFAEGVSWGQDIIDCCSDVVTWPCSNCELMFRLDRVFNVDDQVDDLIVVDNDDGMNGGTDDLSSEVSLRLKMIGQAPSFLRALSVIKRIAKYDATALITGETGTGKELAARALHYLGNNNDGPFVAVNCGGIPDELFENELFGHILGAYTDAKGKQRGYVEQADGGTLFLDEIDALSSKSQTTLLRLLQDRVYKPLGSEKPKHAKIRIVAATNANLRARVAAHQFRQDLLFRLDVLSVDLPSLRNRPGDAVHLASYFMKKFSCEYAKALRPLHPNFISWIQAYSWPGNIRELENTVLRAFLMSDGKFVSQRDDCDEKPDTTTMLGRFSEQKAMAIAGFERQYLVHLLIQVNGNISLAAKLAGKDRRALGKLVQKNGINRLDYINGAC